MENELQSEAGISVPITATSNQSPTLAKLAEALSKAQGLIEGAKKETENPFYKKSYADLASVWGVCRQPLSANGLSVIQLPSYSGGMVHVETIMAHSSGEWISGILSMAPMGEDPQKVGSAISYARRYALASIVGVYQEDDDANAASGKGREAGKQDRPPAKQKTTESQNAAGVQTDAAGYAIGKVEKLEAKQTDPKAPATKGKPYFTFTFQGKKIFCWDPSMFDWLRKVEGSTIEGQIEVRNGYATLISAREVKQDTSESSEERALFPNG